MKARIIESDIKKQPVIFELCDKKYELSLTLNVIDEIQKMFGSLDKLDLSDIGALLKLTEFLVNEAVDNHNDDCLPEEKLSYITSKYIGRKITKDSMSYLVDTITAVFGVSLPSPETEEGADVTEEMIAELADLPEIEKN